MKSIEAAMNGKGFEHDSNFILNKCAKRSCAGVDRISQLPDEITTHILSFLPFKEAVATSILSPRWLNSWKYTPNLIFVNDPYDDPMINIPIVMPLPPIDGPIDWDIERSLKNVQWVNSVLNSYKPLSLKQFTISFYVHPKTFYQVSKWLHFAFSRRVESLKLDFQLASSVLDINMLSGIRSSDYKFLKELTLENVHVTGEAIEFLQRNCSQLEGLIMKATLTSDLVIGGTLKYLVIFSPPSGKFIKVSAPNLTRLLSCNYDYERLFLENVPNLVEASFDLFGPEDTMHHFANAAARLEILTVNLDRPTVFPVPQMPKLKKLVLDYASVNKKYLLPVTCLIQASPCLEEFKLQISDLYMYFFATPICKAIFEVPKHERFQHYHLKVFEFSGFSHEAPDHVELVMYIVNNCIALEEIIVTPIYPSVARQFLQKAKIEDPFLYQVDVIAEEEDALDMKKSTEQLLAGKVPDHIKLLIN